MGFWLSATPNFQKVILCITHCSFNIWLANCRRWLKICSGTCRVHVLRKILNTVTDFKSYNFLIWVRKVTSLKTTQCTVATTIEITTTIEIIISIVVENAYQTKHHIATTIEITTTIEIIISIVVENAFQT